jgi:hypothetical protein
MLSVKVNGAREKIFPVATLYVIGKNQPQRADKGGSSAKRDWVTHTTFMVLRKYRYQLVTPHRDISRFKTLEKIAILYMSKLGKTKSC